MTDNNLNETEQQSLKDFLQIQREKAINSFDSLPEEESSKTDYELTITTCSIGRSVNVKHLVTEESKNITDFDSW